MLGAVEQKHDSMLSINLIVTELEVLTFSVMRVALPIQCLHLKCAAAPSLNPPRLCDPRLSPEA